MIAVKHTHWLLCDGPTSAADVYATTLALMSRGQFVLGEEVGCDYRRALAAVLARTAVAELLASLRPIVVNSYQWGYAIWEA